jgi:hypothetical protein
MLYPSVLAFIILASICHGNVVVNSSTEKAVNTLNARDYQGYDIQDKKS